MKIADTDTYDYLCHKLNVNESIMKSLKKIRLDALSEVSMCDPQMRKVAGACFCVYGVFVRYGNQTKDEEINKNIIRPTTLKQTDSTLPDGTVTRFDRPKCVA